MEQELQVVVSHTMVLLFISFPLWSYNLSGLETGAETHKSLCLKRVMEASCLSTRLWEVQRTKGIFLVTQIVNL